MSKLTDELEYILRWLEYITDLDFENNWYKPGLTRQEIHFLVKDLPFKLSEEIYELYQWQSRLLNSPPHDFLFPEQIGSSTIPLYCLPDSIANYHDLCKLEQSIPEILTKPAHPHQHLQIVRRDAWVITFDRLFVGEGGFEWNF